MKLAEVTPAGILTEAGTDTIELLDERLTATLAEAVWFSVTVQALVAEGLTVAGVQTIEDAVAAATRVTEATCELEPSVAVTIAVWLEVTGLAEAEKLAELAPDGIVMLAGTLKLVLLLLMATWAELDWALSVTVQFPVPGVLTEPGVQDTDDTVGAVPLPTVIEPPLPVRATAEPASDAPRGPEISMLVPLVTVGDRVTLTVAICPF